MCWHFSLPQVSICRASSTWTTSQFSTRMSRRAVLARRSVKSDLFETVQVSPVVNLRFRGCSTRKRRRKEWRWRREKWERRMPLPLGNTKKKAALLFLFCFFVFFAHELHWWKPSWPLCFQFHPHRLQLVQKILDSAGLLQEPRAVLR